MTAFFIPGIDGDGRSSEDTYGKLRREIELDLGRLPRGQRIFRLWSRRGGVDCITEVGRPDPLRGGTVIAIFDMGPHQPFVVCRQQQPGILLGRRVLGQRPRGRIKARLALSRPPASRPRASRSPSSRPAVSKAVINSSAGGGQIAPEQAPERRIAHPDLPLAKFPGEERDRHRNLVRRRPAQQPGDLADLDPAA